MTLVSVPALVGRDYLNVVSAESIWLTENEVNPGSAPLPEYPDTGEEILLVVGPHHSYGHQVCQLYQLDRLQVIVAVLQEAVAVLL